MMYLTGVSNRDVINLQRPDIGLMLNPGNSYHLQIDDYPAFAVDNGCYGGNFNEQRWLRTLGHAAMHQEKCLFAVCPDVFNPHDLNNNHRHTLELWHRYKETIWDHGLPAAFAVQNGCTPDDVPADTDCVFIAGDTAYKLSEVAYAVAATAKAHGKHAHMGRVNSEARMRAASTQYDSADGTYLKYGPDVNLPKLVGWLDGLNYQPLLPMFGKGY